MRVYKPLHHLSDVALRKCYGIYVHAIIQDQAVRTVIYYTLCLYSPMALQRNTVSVKKMIAKTWPIVIVANSEMACKTNSPPPPQFFIQQPQIGTQGIAKSLSNLEALTDKHRVSEKYGKSQLCSYHHFHK